MTRRQEIELKCQEWGLKLSEPELDQLEADTQKDIDAFDAKFGPYLKNMAQSIHKMIDDSLAEVFK